MSKAVCRIALVSFVWAAHAAAFDPPNGDYTKSDPHDIRVMAYNNERHFIAEPSLDDVFARILTVIQPDVICFEEITSDVSDAAIATRLTELLPLEGGGTWHVHSGIGGGIHTVIASRFPLPLTRTDTIPAASTRGVTLALADLPDADYDVDLYLLGVHLKCCGDPGGSEDVSRQKSTDAIANWLGDARGMLRPLDVIELPPNTPMLALGDFNMVGGPQPEQTLITGDIQDEATYGPDVAGDWDGSTMLDVTPADPFTGDTFTWQGDGTFPPGRLDRFFLTDSTATVVHKFILNSNTMSPAALAGTGLQSDDTLPTRASDHLPLVMDLRPGVAPDVPTSNDYGLAAMACLIVVLGGLMIRGHLP